MAKLADQALIVAKIEPSGSYGVDPTPGAGDAMVINNVTIQPIQADALDRNLIDGNLGAKPQMRVNEHVSLEFTIELAGSGGAATPTQWDILMRACGFSRTIVANTSVTYQPVKNGWESITFYFFDDGTRHKVHGARGNVSFSLNVAEIPTATFRFMGLQGEITAVNNPTPTNSAAWKTPLPPNKDNTPTLTLGGYTLKATELSFDMGNNVVHNNTIRSSEMEITARACTGSVTFESPAISNKNFYTIAKAETLVPFALVHGTTAGGIIQINAPKVQLSEISLGDREGIRTMTANMRFTPSGGGNNEISITTK